MAARANSRRSTLSAGILAYCKGARGLEVLLVHPGGPFWRNKDIGAWSIPKGEIEALDNPEQAARREFAEELGPSATPLICNGSKRGNKCTQKAVRFIKLPFLSVAVAHSYIPSTPPNRPTHSSRMALAAAGTLLGEPTGRPRPRLFSRARSICFLILYSAGFTRLVASRLTRSTMLV